MNTKPTTIPFPDLPQPFLVMDFEVFTRVEIGEICGVHPSLITKDCHHLNDLKVEGFDGIEDYAPVPRAALWFLYAIEMFRRAHMLLSKTPIRTKFVKDVNKRGQKAIDFWVKAGGGSREDFDKRVNDFIAKKKCQKLHDAAAIDVQAS
jgi:hypothetical protein